MFAITTSRPRMIRGRLSDWRLLCVLLPGMLQVGVAWSEPSVPGSDAQVLAELPVGARHQSTPARELTRTRLELALPLAQFYVSRSRATGDLRYLGYAEAMLQPWMRQSSVPPAVLVLDATILQSRHAFDAALGLLDRALQLQPDNAQAWLTRATVLRVLGRYDEAMASCARLALQADASITVLCTQSLRGLTGHLPAAYAALVSMPQQGLAAEARAWRYSELGEMAERQGDDQAAEHWFREGLQLAPEDFYMRAACADLLLRQRRAAETLQLLAGFESMEPMLLRIVVAQQLLGDGRSARDRAMLTAAFDVEQQRGEAVHRREQARFLLDVEQQPEAALAAAQENWRVQREPDDVLILLRTAQAAHRPQAALPALLFMQQARLEDVRLEPYRQELR
ncbi:MAG TPA: tetratricopeptide repeat protein [Steroidobacteraceae bacterium]|jgi:tetratricopeptide (TPR) repeat protein|nr:tetratricopeptide repeat protein [Steroidobacteraceae bacterium]